MSHHHRPRNPVHIDMHRKPAKPSYFWDGVLVILTVFCAIMYAMAFEALLDMRGNLPVAEQIEVGRANHAQ